MKKIAFFLPAFFTFFIVQQAHAAPLRTFEFFFEEAKHSRPLVVPSLQIQDYVIEQMRAWHTKGIVITRDDVVSAISGKLETANGDGLCQNKITFTDEEPIAFTMGSGIDGNGCLGLQRDIQSLVDAENEAVALGNDLIASTNGSELSIADEPHRPIKMGALSLALRQVWAGTGSGVLPWKPSADSAFTSLESELQSLSPEELDQIVLQFRHGFFRTWREKDVMMASGTGGSVGGTLFAIAKALDIKKTDMNAVGEFATPVLNVQNVALWARKDDIGLQWIYPAHFVRRTIEPADHYPSMLPNGKYLAYPFEYDAPTSGVPTGINSRTPLCSRLAGKQGYLCRPLSDEPSIENCTGNDSTKISLVQCEKTISPLLAGPNICDGLTNIFKDDGTPFIGADGRRNPALIEADLDTICSAGTKVQYQDDISSHACYIGHCLAESMNGNSLVPNRNPVVVNETTSPYLACMRADPQLGVYSEVAYASPFPLPTYIGHQLVQDFEREYCLKTGDAPRSVLGDCALKEDRRARSPDTDQLATTQKTLQEYSDIVENQASFLSLGTSIGQRMALDQTLVMNRKLYASVAHFIQQMADLLLELKRAPITTTACPWTGPFTSFGK